jgi:hypothetical protein
MKTPIEIRLDCPIDAPEAKSRGIRASLARLLVQGGRHDLGALLARWCPSGKHIFVQAVGSFLTPRTLTQRLSIDGVRFVIQNELLELRTDASLVSKVLSEWEAEILVFFFAENAAAASIAKSLSALEPKWWKLTKSGFEAPYLSQLGTVDPFAFFSPTRSSLEVIGTTAPVLELFDRIRSDLSLS